MYFSDRGSGAALVSDCFEYVGGKWLCLVFMSPGLVSEKLSAGSCGSYEYAKSYFCLL